MLLISALKCQSQIRSNDNLCTDEKKNSIISTMENGKLINENNIDKIHKTFSKNQCEI